MISPIGLVAIPHCSSLILRLSCCILRLRILGLRVTTFNGGSVSGSCGGCSERGCPSRTLVPRCRRRSARFKQLILSGRSKYSLKRFSLLLACVQVSATILQILQHLHAATLATSSALCIRLCVLLVLILIVVLVVHHRLQDRGQLLACRI